MPLYRFECGCGWEVEELFRRHHDAEDTDVPGALVCLQCGAKAPRAGVNRFSHEKVISANMERYESALLSPEQRRAGGFKSAKEIERFEESQGLVRLEPGTPAWDRAWSDQADDAQSIQRRVVEERRAGASGAAAVSTGCDYVDKTEIQGATGWGSLQYDTWKEKTDAAHDAALVHPELLDDG